ncbi:FAD-dependent oxidoreductase [Tessaracoccus defluvii]|uniref:FAD-dependent oxidoreductase n=1 Tax=Tessaracoccus defluvii TaxID=1285901 RepID=UPI0031D99DA7
MKQWRPGRDRRAVRVASPAPSGSGPERPGVVVLGGGIAGLAAATGLAERGVEVTVLEAQPQLGGRVRAWRTDDGRTMSRGFHAFFRQYYNLRSLLRRADPELSSLVPVADYPLTLADGPTDSFARIPRTPPWSILGFVAVSPTFRARDLLRVDVGRALGLLRVSFPRTFQELDGVSAADVLDQLRFPQQARHLALEVFARSFFADPHEFSGGELLAMFHTYFLGSAEGLLFDVPREDYDTALWAPLARYLTGLGVDIRCGVTASAVEPTGTGVRVVSSDGEIRADAAVLALDTAALQSVVDASPGLGDATWRSRIARLRIAPAFGVGRRWLGRPQPDLPDFLGTSGYGPLDNISRLDAFEDGAAAWADRNGGAVVEVHGYALPSPEGVRERLWAEAERVHPPLAGAPIIAEEWLVEQDCPLVDTSPWLDRPTVATPDPRIVLAGDLVRCDLPVALMERAATTGWEAANRLLAGWGRRGHDLWSPPTRGLLAR